MKMMESGAVLLLLWRLVLLLYRCDAETAYVSEGNCSERGQPVTSSGHDLMISRFEPCTSCFCWDSSRGACAVKHCLFPCPVLFAVEDKCCDFICSDGPHRPAGGGGDQVLTANDTILENDDFGPLNPTNIGLRLVASTVTSFLILALLLFMIHRLRQRRLLLMIRRLNGGQMSGTRRFSYDDDGSVGYLTGQDQVDFSLYEDPPPPYSFWKPPETYFPQEEAPPPYESFSTFHSNNSNERQQPQQQQQQQNLRAPLPSNAVTVLENESHPIYPVHYCAPLTTFASRKNDTVPNNESLRTNSFQLNDLDQESQDRRPRHSVPLQELNVVGSLSSLTSSQSDLNESQSVTRTSDSTDVVIRSDATYEDLHPAGLMMPPLTIEAVRARDNYCDQRPFKCHSCSDVVMEDNWPSRAEKRRSLQPGMVKVCSDPTRWNLDASESSSSSSPSFDRTTMSPTSSDSSSIGGYNFESEVVSIDANKKSAANRTGSGSAASSNSVLISSNRITKCGESLDKKLKKGPSKLRQILGSFNANNTVPKKASMRDKKGLGHRDRYSVGTSAQVELMAGEAALISDSNEVDTVWRTPRILYVSDGDISQKSLNLAPAAVVGRNNKVERVIKKTPKCRPHSYDFGDLNTAGATAAIAEEDDSANPVYNCGRGPAAATDQTKNCLFRQREYQMSSLDSFTCTCSSRASFDSGMLMQNSSTFHSQEGLAVSPELQRCSSTVAEPPSSPENGEDGEEFDSDNKWTVRHQQEQLKVGKLKGSNNRGFKSSRSNGARRRQQQQQLCNQMEDELSDGETIGDGSATISQPFVPNNTRLRLTLDVGPRGSHESYI